MKKHNPLFLDSTQPVGDKVITNVELLDASLQAGAAFYIEVADSFGFVQKHALKMISTKKSVRYCTELWLNNSEAIQYRFMMVASGTELQSSPMKESLAGNSISEKWDPSGLPAAQSVRGKPKGAPKKAKTTEIKKVSSSKGQGSLVAAQDYQQMKFLLGELE